MKRVLFLCTNNSARSQMAEAILRAKTEDEYEVYSAGTLPTTLDPLTVTVLGEIGIRTSGHYAKSLDSFFHQKWDFVITVCDRAKERCPIFPLSTWLHWSITRPTDLASFRAIRDELIERIDRFMAGERRTDGTGRVILAAKDEE